MQADIHDGFRNGVPPFALCHLLAKQMRLRHGARGLRLSRATAMPAPSGSFTPVPTAPAPSFTGTLQGVHLVPPGKNTIS